VSEFVLQDNRSYTGDRLMFWAQGGGYTSNLDLAERYTQEKALAQNQCRETDIPWPLAYLTDRAELAVDCQYLKPADVDAGLQGADRGYLYAAGAWNGNDLYWLTNDSDITSDFRRAHAFPMNIAKSMAAPKHHNVHLAPAPLVESLARKVVPKGGVKIGIALRGTGIKLAKPPRARSIPDRCEHCGVFISNAQRFQDCPKCGGDNAP